ncbi:hypothetical protein [Streptomyces cyslabdanicus]|uniref:hypothetical protein n=1 Tax=Streptomyces cyslabdanicus TaxID=1470456 RepID=UPI004044D92C
MQVLSLGIDFPSYSRFKIIVPDVQPYGDGSQRYTVTEWDEARTADDYAWAEHFVIESALRAARADGVQELTENRSEAIRKHEGWFERTWTGPAGDE